MSKIILCLFLLFNIYACEKPKNIKIFDNRDGKDNLIKISSDEEFKLKLYCGPMTIPWILLNENETQKYLQLLKNYKNCVGFFHRPGGMSCYTYFHFKALKKTKEDLILKFRLGNDDNRVDAYKIKVE